MMKPVIIWIALSGWLAVSCSRQDGESSRQVTADPAAAQSDEGDSLAKAGSSPTATPLPFDIYWYDRSFRPWNPPERVASPGASLVMTTNDARNPNVSVKMRERFPCDNGEWDYSIYYTGAKGVDNPACPRRVVKLHSPERDLNLKPGCGRFKYPLTDCELQPDDELGKEGVRELQAIRTTASREVTETPWRSVKLLPPLVLAPRYIRMSPGTGSFVRFRAAPATAMSITPHDPAVTGHFVGESGIAVSAGANAPAGTYVLRAFSGYPFRDPTYREDAMTIEVVNGLSFDPVPTHLNLGMSQKYTARENGSASGFTYSVQPQAMGVTINASTGALSVASTARRGIYTVKATKGAKSVMSMLVVLQNVKPGSGNDRPFALKLGEFKQFPSFTFPGVNPDRSGFWQYMVIFPPRTGLTEYPMDRLDQLRVLRAASDESLAGRYVNILKYGRESFQPGYDPTEEDIILPFKILRADGSDPSIARAEAEPKPLPTPGVQVPARIVAQPVPPPMPGESAWRPGGRFKCTQPYPGPANLRMYVDKDNQVILNWQDLGGEVSYEVRTCQKETCGAEDWSLVRYERFYPGVSALDATGQFAIGGYYRYMPEFFGDYKKLTSSILRARVRAVSGAGPYKDYNCIGRYSAEAVLVGPSPHMNPTVTEVIPGSSSIKVKLTPPARATHERYPVCAFEYQVEETPVAGANSHICRAMPTFDYRGNATCPDDTGLRGNGSGGGSWWYRGYQRLACPNGNSPLPEFLEIPFTESQLAKAHDIWIFSVNAVGYSAGVKVSYTPGLPAGAAVTAPVLETAPEGVSAPVVEPAVEPVVDPVEDPAAVVVAPPVVNTPANAPVPAGAGGDNALSSVVSSTSVTTQPGSPETGSAQSVSAPVESTQGGASPVPARLRDWF